jgi:hypothetical protein
MSIEKYIPSIYRLEGFSRHDKWYLLAITIIGAIIRILYLYNRPFVGDEIGTLIYLEKDIPYILSHFTTWLTMNYFIVLEKLVGSLFGKSALSLEFIPLTAGILTIPLTAILASQFTVSRVPLIAATLVAMNPYLVRYSAIIRSYSLLTALSLFVMTAFFLWDDVRTYYYGTIVALGCYVLILAHPNGVYPLAFFLLIIGRELVCPAKREKPFKTATTLLLPLSISLLMVAISYAKIFPEMLQAGVKNHDTPPTSVTYITYIFTGYFSWGFYGWVSAIFFITGVLTALKYEKPLALILPSIFLPILLISIQGLSVFPWDYARFLIFIVPLIILFIAEGIHFYSTTYVSKQSLRSIMMSLLLLLVVLTWLPPTIRIFNVKKSFPWHEVASFIKTHMKEGDIILGSAWKDSFHLRPYFSETAHSHLFHVDNSALRHNAVSIPTRVFFITSANFVDTASPVYYFGKIQVIIYTPSPDQSFLRIMRDDFVNTAVKADNKIDPEFTSLYRNILDINHQLESTDNNFYYYNLWIKCLELTPRQRNIPFNLQRGESEDFVKHLSHTQP